MSSLQPIFQGKTLPAHALVRHIEAWHSNDLKRLVKSPKLAFIDSGLLATLRGARAENFTLDKTKFGAVLESFVGSLGFSVMDHNILCFRIQANNASPSKSS